MNAIVVRPGVKDSIHMRDMPDPEMGSDQVAVKMLRVGLCATDADISDGAFGEAPEGEEFLILGHENLGIVEEVGRKVKGFRPGDLVVATVRRPCGICAQCHAGQSDMCGTGRYTERGIMRLHGFMAQYYVESPRFLNRIPRALREVAVLLEPMSIVEKAIDNAFLMQRRLAWTPSFAMVLGAGPVGLLAAAVLVIRGLRTVVIGREHPQDPRARAVSRLGADYVSVANKTLLDVTAQTGHADIIIEATGSAKVVFDAMQMMARNGVLCLLSVTIGHGLNSEPIDTINQRLVLGNQVVFGSVNANIHHFKLGIRDFARIEKKFPGALGSLLTNPIPWHDYKTWFAERTGIKATLEIA